jgi:hypothetical protein
MRNPMNFESYVAYLRRRRSQCEESRAALSHGRMWSNRGLCLVDTTDSWRAELDRRVTELSTIIRALERRQSI